MARLYVFWSTIKISSSVSDDFQAILKNFFLCYKKQIKMLKNVNYNELMIRAHADFFDHLRLYYANILCINNKLCFYYSVA